VSCDRAAHRCPDGARQCSASRSAFTWRRDGTRRAFEVPTRCRRRVGALGGGMTYRARSGCRPCTESRQRCVVAEWNRTKTRAYAALPAWLGACMDEHARHHVFVATDWQRTPQEPGRSGVSRSSASGVAPRSRGTTGRPGPAGAFSRPARGVTNSSAARPTCDTETSMRAGHPSRERSKWKEASARWLRTLSRAVTNLEGVPSCTIDLP
jgi:hypothetical protein